MVFKPEQKLRKSSEVNVDYSKLLPAVMVQLSLIIIIIIHNNNFLVDL